MKSFKKKLFLLSMFGVLGIMLTMGPVCASEAVHLKLSTIQAGGSWYVLGGILSKILTAELPKGSTVDVIIGPGAAGNPTIIEKGDAALAFSFNTNAFWASKGIEGYKDKHVKVLGLAGGLGERVICQFSRKDFPYNSMREAFQKKHPVKLFIYQRGSGAYQTAIQLLKLYGVSIEDINSWGGSVTYGSYPNMNEYLTSKKVDMWFGGTAVKGHPTLTEISTSIDMKFIPLEDDIIRHMVAEYGYSHAVQGANWFKGQTEPIKTFAVVEGLIVAKDVSEEIAYKLTKTLIENKKRIEEAYPSAAMLTGEKAATTTGVTLHPGSAKYYKEAGFIK